MTNKQKQIEFNLIQNYINQGTVPDITHPKNLIPKTEDFVKYHTFRFLISNNYVVLQVAYGKAHGTDILAKHKETKKILKIEAKGASYHNADGVNLNTAIGELLRDLDPNIDYMLAFPSDTGLQKWYLKDYKLFKSIMSPYGLNKIFTVYDNGEVKIEE